MSNDRAQLKGEKGPNDSALLSPVLGLQAELWEPQFHQVLDKQMIGRQTEAGGWRRWKVMGHVGHRDVVKSWEAVGYNEWFQGEDEGKMRSEREPDRMRWVFDSSVEAELSNRCGSPGV